MYCSKCGSNVAPDAAFCGACGTPVGHPAPLPSAQGLSVPYPGTAIQTAYADPAGLAVSRGFAYAGFWLRVVAYLIDGAILGAAILVLFVPLLFLTGLAANLESLSRTHGQPNPAAFAGLIAVILLLVVIGVLIKWLYFAYLESGERQATWGKQAMGIYVTDLLGNRLSFGHASGRFFAKMVSSLIPLGIGYIMAGFTERKQALHDMIASCLVLRR